MSEFPKDPCFVIAKRWADDVYVTRPSNVPELVYHYTDAPGMMGMLRSGKIWATDHRFLNDKTEVAHTRRQIREVISRELGQAVEEIAFKLYSSILRAQERERLSEAFVFSLSQQKDDLSQWRGYAREGEGFTLGFCGQTLCKIAEPDEAPFAFLQVDYSHTRQARVLKQALSEMVQHLVQEHQENPGETDRRIITAASSFDWLVEARAIANKHRSFRSEREWRVVAHANPATTEVKVRTSGLRLVRYIEVPFDEEESRLPLKSIGIGPGFSGNEEVLAVRTLCKEMEYDPKIYFADTPYRRL